MLEVVDLRESLVALVSVLQLLLEFISVVCVVTVSYTHLRAHET